MNRPVIAPASRPMFANASARPALPPPAPAPRKAPRLAAVLVGLTLLGLTGAAAWNARGQLDGLLDVVDERNLQAAALAFEQDLQLQRRLALSQVNLLVDDTRVRGTVVTSRFDEATVKDVLDDLKQASQASALAVLDASGKVLAVSGLPALRQGDLSAARAVKAALDRPTADVWTFGQQLLVVAMAPMRAGPEVRALLLVAFEIGPSALQAVERTQGVRGALVVADRVVARGAAGEALDGVFRRAAGQGETSGLLAEGTARYRYRWSRTGDAATAARAVWAGARHSQLAAAGSLPHVLWMPVVAVGLMWLLLVALVRR